MWGVRAGGLSFVTCRGSQGRSEGPSGTSKNEASQTSRASLGGHTQPFKRPWVSSACQGVRGTGRRSQRSLPLANS